MKRLLLAVALGALLPATAQASDVKIRWSRFLDGSIWLFRQGEDFDCSPKVFRHRARSAAGYHLLSIRTAETEDEGKPAVVIQSKGHA